MVLIYDVVIRSNNLVQGNRPVMDFYNELNGSWSELNHYMPLDLSLVDHASMLRLCVFKFLMGLNPDFEPLQTQLVHREKNSDLKGGTCHNSS